jgi:hypothetical protein
VTSRGATPVPPVVSTSCASSVSSSIADAISLRSSGTTRRVTSNPSAPRSSARSDPLSSARSPRATPSEIVRTAALRRVPSSSRAGGPLPASSSRRPPSPCRRS